jgi:hypothetical protein
MESRIIRILAAFFGGILRLPIVFYFISLKKRYRRNDGNKGVRRSQEHAAGRQDRITNDGRERTRFDYY